MHPLVPQIAFLQILGSRTHSSAIIEARQICRYPGDNGTELARLLDQYIRSDLPSDPHLRPDGAGDSSLQKFSLGDRELALCRDLQCEQIALLLDHLISTYCPEILQEVREEFPRDYTPTRSADEVQHASF